MIAFVGLWTARWGTRAVPDITPGMVEAYRQSRAQGRGAGMLNRERSELKQMFDFAVALGLRGDNPVGVWKRLPEEVQREYVVLTREQEKDLVSRLRSGVLCRFVTFAIATGLRQGTIRQLTWEMVKDGVLEVPAAVMKTRQPVRMPLSRKAGAMLSVIGPELFVGLPGAQRLRAEIKEAARAIGLPALTPHDFRRTWVARMAEAGATMLDVMYLGGWSRPNALLRHYLSVPEARARELLETI